MKTMSYTMTLVGENNYTINAIEVLPTFDANGKEAIKRLLVESKKNMSLYQCIDYLTNPEGPGIEIEEVYVADMAMKETGDTSATFGFFGGFVNTYSDKTGEA